MPRVGSHRQLGLTRFDGHPSSGVRTRKDVRPSRASGGGSPGAAVSSPRAAMIPYRQDARRCTVTGPPWCCGMDPGAVGAVYPVAVGCRDGQGMLRSNVPSCPRTAISGASMRKVTRCAAS